MALKNSSGEAISSEAIRIRIYLILRLSRQNPVYTFV